MEEFLIIAAIGIFFIAGPIALIGHYVTEWRKTKVLTPDDEQTLDDLRGEAEKLESRLESLERILDDEVPDWRSRRHDTL